MAKLELHELIPDRYYCCKHSYYENVSLYYKFKSYSDDKLHFYNFKITEKDGVFSFFQYVSVSSTLDWFNNTYIFEEISINVIGECLPDEFPDKIYYLRKKKINTLLNEY